MKLWIKAASRRAIRTIAKTAVALIRVSMLISEVMVGSAALLAGILSILISIAILPEVDMENKIAINK